MFLVRSAARSRDMVGQDFMRFFSSQAIPVISLRIEVKPQVCSVLSLGIKRII